MRQIKRGHYKEDEFQSTMEKLMKYVVRHKERSMLVGAAALVVIVLIILFAGRGEQRNPQADLLHTQAIGLMAAGRIQEAEGVLTDLTQRFQNTRAGKVGLYYLGVIAYHTGRFSESLGHFDKFLGVVKNDYLLTPSALMGAGSAAEGIGEYEKAQAYYEKLTKDKKSHMYGYGVLAYARIKGLLGDTQTAREILKNLLEEEPPADIAADARFYLGYFNQ